MHGITLKKWDAFFIGLCLEGFFYGLYSGIFVMYIQHHAPQKGSHKPKNILFYALCALYVLSVASFVLDTIYFFIFQIDTLLHVTIIRGAVNGCCDFIAQSILIYRCWIVWGCNIHVVILPSILAFTFLVSNGSEHISKGQQILTYWGYTLSLTSFAMSLVVNALVTGLIVFRITKVYREVKPTLNNQLFGIKTGGSKLRPAIFVLIESGMALFAVQLVQLVLITLVTINIETIYKGFLIIMGARQMLNGITPTIILVRTAMGLSFHDEESMIETTGSFHLAFDNRNLNLEVGTVGIEPHEGRDNTNVQEINDIDIVDR